MTNSCLEVSLRGQCLLGLCCISFDPTVIYISSRLRRPLAVLNSGKHVDLALEVSVVALLHEDKWDEAIIACNVRPELQFHKAYALYKKDRFAEALATIAASTDSGTGGVHWRHLRGQILFRLGRHAEAAAQYDALVSDLLAEGSDCDPFDLADARTNLAATLVAADQPASATQHAALTSVLEAIRRGKVRLRAGFAVLLG